MNHHPLRSKVIDRFAQSWSRANPNVSMIAVEHLTSLYDKFRKENLADRIFEEQLISASSYTYAQRVAELLLAEMLWADGFSLKSSNEGPDFLATKNEKSVWIELHTPIPNGIPPGFFTQESEPAIQTVPFDAIALRWTTALSEKINKLEGYLRNGVVKPDESYIIAINSSLLNKFSMSGLNGLSGKPVLVEILFGVGALQIHIDRENGKIVDQSHQYRPKIQKPGTVNTIPSDSFLDKKNAKISAVLGLSLLEQSFFGYKNNSAIVYNPNATNPVAAHWLSAQEHWACEMGLDSYLVNKLQDADLLPKDS